MQRPRFVLERSPITTTIVYTVVGVLPLYLTAAQSVRLQEELSFGRTEFGIAVAAFYLASALASRLVGPVLDRGGPRLGFRFSGIFTVVSAGTALAAGNWVMVAFALAFAGVANAFGQVASNLVVATVVSESRRGIGFGFKQAAVPIAAMLSGLAIPWVGIGIDWRAPYVFAVGCGLVAAMIAPGFQTGTKAMRGVPFRTTPALVALMVTAGIGAAVGNTLASFITDASVTRGFSQAAGARVLTLGSIIAIVTRISIGRFTDRREGDGVREVVSLLTVALVGLAILSQAGESDGLFIAGVILAFGGTWGWQGLQFYVVISLIRMPAASATGSVAAGAYLGTMLLPPLIGAALERTSYATVFALFGGMIVLTIAMLLFSRRLALGSDSTSNPRGSPG